jgi:trimethylamine--corrinoid protein Co-methyltransferase
MTNDALAVDRIHRNSLRLLNELGMVFHSGNALALLRSGGIRVEGNRAYFTPEQVMRSVDMAVKNFTVRARNPKYNVRMNPEELYVTPGYGSPYVCETDGTRRSATMEDFLKLVMIVQESDIFSINGGILAQPSDVDASISAETMVYATLCRSDKALFSVCNGKRQAANILELLRTTFGSALPAEPVSFHLISTLSPLAIDGNALDTISVFAPEKQCMVLAPGPMAGGTGPVSPAGNVSLANAEILATNVFTQLLSPGTPVVYGFAATVSDLRDMKVSNACPGFVVQSKYGALMAKKYGFPCRSGGGMSDAGGLTAQAGVETSISLFESFSQKANLVMHATGSLDSFNAVSLEKFVMDIETIDRLRFYFQELDTDEDSLAFNVIRDVVEGESFILHEHTLERCRQDQWISQVSLHGPAKGEPNAELYASIRRRMDKLLSGYRRPPMDEGVRAALDRKMRSLGLAEDLIAQI